MTDLKQAREPTPIDEGFARVFIESGVHLSRSKKAAIRELTQKWRKNPTDRNKQALLSRQSDYAIEAKAPRSAKPSNSYPHASERQRIRPLKQKAVAQLARDYAASFRNGYPGPDSHQRWKAWDQLRGMTLSAFIFAYANASEKEARIRERIKPRGDGRVAAL